MKIDLTFKDLEIEEISGRVSAQVFEDTLRIGMASENQLIDAVVDSGALQLRFFNRLPLASQITYTLPDIVQETSGMALSGQVTLQPGDSATQNIQTLQGYRVFNSRTPGQVIDTLTIQLSAISDTGVVVLRASDEVGVRFISSDLLFRRLEGYLAPDSFDLEPLVAEDLFEYGTFTGGIEIQGIQLILKYYNEIDIQDLRLSGLITGYRIDDNDIIVDSAEVQIPEQLIRTGNNIIVLQGTEIDQLVNMLPTDLKATGRLAYSGYARVSAGDIFSGEYIFTTPFWVNITNAAAIQIEPDTLTEIDQDIRRGAGDNLTNARLEGRVLNFSPLSGQGQIFFSRDFTRMDLYDTTSYFNPTLEFIKTVAVPAAQVDPVTGFVTQPAEETFTMELNPQEISIFHSPPIRLGLILHLDNTNGFVILRGSDYLEFSGNIEIRIVFRD